MRLVVAILVAIVAVLARGGVIPAGTQLRARLDTTIATTESAGAGRYADVTRVGAPFAATVEEPISDEHGRERLPAGAILSGHVTRVTRGEGIRRATVELAVDRLDRFAIRGRVFNIDVQQLPHADPGGQVDTTTFWGMLVGGVAFGVPGVAVGHGFGAAVGGVNAARARVVDGWVSAGTQITVELEEPLSLAPCVAARTSPTC